MSGLLARLLGGVLLALLLAAGAGWYLAADARDRALADLATERATSDDLRTAIREQNRATEALAKATAAADARGALAQQLATTNGRRFDAAVAKLANVRATTCGEAMPFVNQVLEAVR